MSLGLSEKMGPARSDRTGGTFETEESETVAAGESSV
jgi:hypothetical protein